MTWGLKISPENDLSKSAEREWSGPLRLLGVFYLISIYYSCFLSTARKLLSQKTGEGGHSLAPLLPSYVVFGAQLLSCFSHTCDPQPRSALLPSWYPSWSLHFIPVSFHSLHVAALLPRRFHSFFSEWFPALPVALPPSCSGPVSPPSPAVLFPASIPQTLTSVSLAVGLFRWETIHLCCLLRRGGGYDSQGPTLLPAELGFLHRGFFLSAIFSSPFGVWKELRPKLWEVRAVTAPPGEFFEPYSWPVVHPVFRKRATYWCC